jgi:hypothetical protein
MDLRKLIDLVEDDKEDEEGKLKGFDSKTMRTLAAIRGQYPNAPDDLSAILRHLTHVDNDSDTADEDHITRLVDLEQRVSELEKQIKEKN